METAISIVDARRIENSLLVPTGAGTGGMLPTIGANILNKFIYVLSRERGAYLCLALNIRYNLISVQHTRTMKGLMRRFPFLDGFYVGGPMHLEYAFLLVETAERPQEPVSRNCAFDLLYVEDKSEVGAVPGDRAMAFFGCVLIDERNMFKMIGSQFALANLRSRDHVFQDDAFLRRTYGQPRAERWLN